MKNREILTLQFGNYANYVGTHFWNIQESGFQYGSEGELSEINHDVMFREGQNHRGEVTYTPRMLCVDLNGALSHLAEDGELYSDDTTVKLRSGDLGAVAGEIPWQKERIEVVREGESSSKPAFQKDLQNLGQNQMEVEYNFSKTVNSWTDFMYSRYHPRSINIIKDYNHSDEENSFDTFSNGRGMWKNDYFDDEFGDRIRHYMEECDSCQGFQVTFDCTDGFSGLTTKCLEDIKDDHGKTILVYPLIPPPVRNFKKADGPMTSSIQVVNLAMCFASLVENSSLFVPLSTMVRGWRDVVNSREFPNVSYDSMNLYQSSAILATFLDTMTMKFRAKDNLQPQPLSEFCADLNGYGWNLCSANLGLPFSVPVPGSVCDTMDGSKALFTHLTPNSEISEALKMHTTVRGIHRMQIASMDPRESRPVQPAELSVFPYGAASFKLEKLLTEHKYGSSIPVMAMETPMPVKIPFPEEIFSREINQLGYLGPYPRESDMKMISTPVLASISSTKKTGETIDSLHRVAERVKLAKLPRFRETGLESDEYTETLHKLLDFRDLYDDNMQL
ncbi:Protein misato [Sergentomyia squamirostris]